jgi:hypothetical protein
MAWWDRPGEPDRPRLRDRLRSLYEDRFRERPAGPVKMVVQQGAGRVIGYEIDGEFVETKPCCDDPARCEREECWTMIFGPWGERR